MSGVLLLARVLVPEWGTLARSSAGAGTSGLLHPTTASSTASLGAVILAGARWGWSWKWTQRLFLPGLAIHGAVLYLSASRLAIALGVVLIAATWLLHMSRRTLAGVVLLFKPSGRTVSGE